MKALINQLELKALYKISQVIGQALNLDQTLEIILSTLSEDLSMKRGAITIIDFETGKLAIRASHGLTNQEKKRGVYRFDEGITGKIFSSNEPFVVPDVSKDPLFLNRTGARTPEKGRISFIGVPIGLNGYPIGVLSADKLFEADISFEEDVRFLSILAAFIGQLISLNEQVKAREKTLVRANLFLKEKISRKSDGFFSIARSPAILEAQQLVKKVAPTRATVLILGESGTGKTLVAQIIHELSSRSRNPFIKVNSAALPENLLEAELFGYERGAFTGATEARTGRVEEAEGGTLFLDEIGEMSLPVQAKLLRFLQDKEFERLGSSKTRKVDARIIAATNRDLSTATSTGEFRQDLYYRLNVFPIRVPPLRERQEDIVGLLTFFTRSLVREYGAELHFSPKAIEALIRYSWPGNVRELENLLERLAIMSENGLIDIGDLTPYLAHVPKDHHTPVATTLSRLDSLTEMEKRGVVAALERNGWIQSRAARDLGITLRQMGYRVRKFGLEDYLKRKKLFI